MQQSRKFSILGHTAEAPPLEAGLYIVSTPIGNLGDITVRALQVLAGAQILAAEDTRTTRILLQRYGISARPVAYHDHNADAAGPRLIESVAQGASVALVSDAGTPLVSDPGYRLVRLAIHAGVPVIPVPGPSAILAALVGAGLPTDAFLFAGFPPSRGPARRSWLEKWVSVPATLIFHESPRRLPECLADMARILGMGRQCVIARELTKRFEEFRRGTLDELAGQSRAEGAPKGEVVICIGPPEERESLDVDLILRRLAGEMPASRAAAEAARLTGLARADLYRRLLQLPERPDARDDG